VGHVAFGLAFPLAVYAVGTVAFPDRAGTLAVVSHGAAVVVTSGAYLLRRHRAVGLP
jgi:K+-transporting ATPase c subunit